MPGPLDVETLVIDPRFNGPPGSANGGYTCGLVAGLVGAEVTEVTLRLPPPLGRPLSVHRPEEGRVEVLDGDALVAEGRCSELLQDVPDAIPYDEIAAAQRDGAGEWARDHPFPTCFVCGPQRREGDGMRIWPVALPGRDTLFGATWTPDETVSDGDGLVLPEIVWAALDCPSSAPAVSFSERKPVVLGRLTARLGCSVRAGERHTILAWELGRDGRKRESASALYDSEGRLLCAARAVWIELRG